MLYNINDHEFSRILDMLTRFEGDRKSVLVPGNHIVQDKTSQVVFFDVLCIRLINLVSSNALFYYNLLEL